MTAPTSRATKASIGPRAKQPARRRRRKPADPGRAWARRLERTRPGLVTFALDELAGLLGRPAWQRRLDPTTELVLTILTQNSADTNAERAYESLRAAYPSSGPVQVHELGGGWGGLGLTPGVTPEWAAVEAAPLPELIDVIRPGGLAFQKAPRIQAALRRIREERGDYSLEFLGDLSPLDARAWLTAIDGIGPKTASIVLLFCFGMPLMPVDRHVERVSKRVGLLPAKATADQAHDLFLAILPADRTYEAHVNLIRHGRLVCHAQRPDHAACPLIARCRFVEPKAP